MGVHFMAGFVRVAVVVFCLSISASSTIAQELRISHHFPQTVDARDRASRIFAEELQLRAPELKVSVHPKLSLGLQRDEQLDRLQAGTLEMAVFPLVYGVKKIPEFSLALLPGLIPSAQAIQALKGSAVHERLQEIAEANGLHIVTWWWLRGGFVSTSRQISGPDSVANLKLRGGDRLYQMMLRGAGALPVDLPSGQIHGALKSGTIDGALTSFENVLSLRLYEQAKFATFGSNSLWTYFTPLLISKKVWDGLTEEQRLAMAAAAEIADAFFEATQRDVAKRALLAFRKAGVKVRQLTHADYIAWLQIAQRTAWVEYAKMSPEAGALIFGTIRVLLEEFATKEYLKDSSFDDDEK